MSQPDDDDLLRLVSEAFDEDLGEPPAHLTDAAKALRPRRSELGGSVGSAGHVGDELAQRRVYRLNRHLAAAAASTNRDLQASYRSNDGSILTEVSENDEGHLTVTVTSENADLLYVELAWTLITGQGVDRRSRLVTPLASNRQGVSVRYDLGPVDDADAVDIEPAEPVAVASLCAVDFELAFALVPTGASRRAWIRAEAVHRVNGDPLADAIADALNR